MIRLSTALAVAAGLAGTVGVAFAAAPSSHREAPAITEMPKVDGTDFYMFNSYERGRDGFVTIIANYLPLQDPYGGPNYFFLDPEARYEIHVDNDGDSHEDITFRFRFHNNLKDIQIPVGNEMVSVPLLNVGPIAAGQTGPLNIEESYTVSVIFADSPSIERPLTSVLDGSDVFMKPVDNIGNKSIPNYGIYAAAHIYGVNIPRSGKVGRVFVGQRKDPFVVNLGETFDLVNLNPLGPENSEKNTINDANVTSFVIEMPADWLRNYDNDFVVGGWTTASLPRNRVLKNNPTFEHPSDESGDYVQVSRLGMPLVNEVVIGIRDKDLFNASHPSGDGQFLTYVTNPTLPVLLNALFGVTPPCLPRNDLVSVFLTGVPGLNQPQNVVPSEMLRLNTNTDPNAGGIAVKRRSQQNRLGVLGGDLQGFPNGRRPGDDVVDIELRAVMGVLYPDAGDPNGCAPHGDLPFTDGAFVSDLRFLNGFPYVTTPLAGSPN